MGDDLAVVEVALAGDGNGRGRKPLCQQGARRMALVIVVDAGDLAAQTMAAMALPRTRACTHHYLEQAEADAVRDACKGPGSTH